MAADRACVMYRARIEPRSALMPDPTGIAVTAAIEQCVDEIDDFIETLERYPEPVIAMALRVHLGALLRAMVDDQLCSREQVREFVAALEQDALGRPGQ
jgi:hypothetical protein